MNIRILAVVAICAIGVSFAGPAHSQTGVSEDRVSLPEGPGSLEGVGDDVEIDPNMGALAYEVPILYPEGFPGLTPDLSVSYNSGIGASVVGVGWELPLQSIERRTVAGVPRYIAEDEFQANGQLVYVGGDEPRVYRNRFENEFVRYNWFGPADGGYWVAELPDGRVATYGASHSGTLESAALVGGDRGTFRYLLREMQDVHGHRIVYDYEESGSTSLLVGISYVFVDGNPQYEIALEYEERDDRIVNASGGFEEVLSERLTEIRVFARGAEIRSYQFEYETYDESGGFSRLSGVHRLGVGGDPYPAEFSFGYAAELGAICTGVDCSRPFVRSLGNIGVNFQTGDPQLIDLNGDALPDIVDSTLGDQPHRIFINTLRSDGTHFFAPSEESEVGEQDTHDFSLARVQVLDMNGDGFTDAVNAGTGVVLWNRGRGDWDDSNTHWEGTTELPDFAADFTESELQTIRFLDYDNDRLIDVIKASGSGTSHSTQMYRNTGAGFDQDLDVEPIGAGFDSDTLELNDFNGDGLIDPVQVFPTFVRYRLNLGYGRWAPADDWYQAEILGAGLELSETDDAELEDLNGDGLTDLVLVRGSSVEVWINRAGERMEPMGLLTDEDLGGDLSIPEVTPTTTVLFADMNGNGSTDIVWVQPDGEMAMLDLYPVRPNLMSRIENGIGFTLDVEYRSSVEFAASSEEPWRYRLPFPNMVVWRVTESDLWSDLPRVREFEYAHGRYDGLEKQFRGFEEVEQVLIGDETQESFRTTQVFDVGAGADGPYYAGLELESEVLSERGSMLYGTSDYGDCEVAQTTGAEEPAIRHICLLSEYSEIREARPSSEWVSMQTDYTYDGYGNVERVEEQGVTAIGGGGCAPCDGALGPCGATCLGDERTTESQFADTEANVEGRWITDRVVRERSWTGDPTDFSETRYFYDGEPFQGLDSGEVGAGLVTRVERRLDETTAIDVERFQYDADGNPVVELDPDASPTDWDGRRLLEYSDDGLRVSAVEIPISAGGNEYKLRRTYRYDSSFDKPSFASIWHTIEAGEPTSPAPGTLYAYDAHGRVVSITMPDDSPATPTREFAYEFAEDHVRMVSQSRSVSGASPDLEEAECVDGRGRLVQVRTQLAPGLWRVSDHVRYNALGEVVQTFQPYESTTGLCEVEAALGTEFESSSFDALGRPSVTELPGGAQQRWEYAPLEVAEYQPGDNNPESPYFDTPVLRRTDGLDQTIAVGRTGESGDVEWFMFGYDHTGQLSTAIDPEGIERLQHFDDAGRLVLVEDADRGEIRYERDGLGRAVRIVDATPFVERRAFDGAGRLVREWIEGVEDSEISYEYDFAGDCPGGRCSFPAGNLVATRFHADGMEVVDWGGYDSRGEAVWSRRDFEHFAVEFESTFDNVGRLVSETLPAGHEISRILNGAGEPVAIPRFVEAITLEERGLLAGLSLANGATMAREYDERGNVESLAFAMADARVASEFDYTDDSWLEAVVDRSDVMTGPSLDAAYTYDAFGRLVGAALSPGQAEFDETVSYQYDGSDNITARLSTLGDSPVNDGVRTMDDVRPHAVASIGELTMEYDEAGQMTRRGLTTYDWDGFGRIASSTAPNGSQRTYGYGRDSERVIERSAESTRYFAHPTTHIADGVLTFWVRVGTANVARVDDASLATVVLPDLAPARHIDGTVQSEGDGMISAADAWLAYMAAEGTLEFEDPIEATVTELLNAAAATSLIGNGSMTTWLHTDLDDSVIATSDEDGVLLERMSHYPFGHPRWSSSNHEPTFGFTGEYSESDRGLVHIGDRAYDHLLGRWLEPDGAFEQISPGELSEPWEAMGTYVYGWNTPVNGQDHTGESFDLSFLSFVASKFRIDARTNSVRASSPGQDSAPRDTSNTQPTTLTNISRQVTQRVGPPPQGSNTGSLTRQVSGLFRRLASFLTNNDSESEPSIARQGGRVSVPVNEDDQDQELSLTLSFVDDIIVDFDDDSGDLQSFGVDDLSVEDGQIGDDLSGGDREESFARIEEPNSPDQSDGN